MAVVYILYSTRIDKYYVGSTVDAELRLAQHNSGHFAKSFTGQTSDWEIFLKIDCLSYEKSRLIEQHIKSRKSRRYIENLKKYPEMIELLVNKKW